MVGFLLSFFSIFLEVTSYGENVRHMTKIDSRCFWTNVAVYRDPPRVWPEKCAAGMSEDYGWNPCPLLIKAHAHSIG